MARPEEAIAVAELSDRDLDKIIKRDMPGYRMARRTKATDERAREAEPDARSPDLDALRKKFLGKDATGADELSTDAAVEAVDADEPATVEEADADETIVPVEPEAPRDPTDQRSHSKVAVVSNRDQKVIGSQG
jgi:hypothetical protein